MTKFITVPMPAHNVPSLPPYVLDMLNKQFSAAQVLTLCHAWHTYSELTFGRSTEAQIVREARMILRLESENSVRSEQRYAQKRINGHAAVTWFCGQFGAPVNGWKFQGHEDSFVTLSLGSFKTTKSLQYERQLVAQIKKAGGTHEHDWPQGPEFNVKSKGIDIVIKRYDDRGTSSMYIQLSAAR